MKPNLLPSLREMASIKSCTEMWNDIDKKKIEYFLEKYPYIKSYPINGPTITIHRTKIWVQIERQVKIKVFKLNIPKPVKKDILRLIKAVGIEILKWLEYHCVGGYLNIKVPKRFHWTAYGTIDLKKTAELSVKDKSVCLTYRYKLALIYCLEEEIERLPRLCEHCGAVFPTNGQHAQDFITFFWTSCMNSEIISNNHQRQDLRPYEIAFEHAAARGHIVATTYFWNKLLPEEKRNCASITATNVAHKCCEIIRSSSELPRDYYATVMYFLLSQLEENEQNKVIIAKPLAFFQCLSNDQLYNFFMKIINDVWEYIPLWGFTDLFMNIASRDFLNKRYHDYSSLFTVFWLQMPSIHKRQILSQCSIEYILYLLFMHKDVKNISLIFEEMSSVEKRDVFSRMNFQYLFPDLIEEKEWKLLKMLIEECQPSQEQLVNLKEEFGVCAKSKRTRKEFENLVDRFIDMTKKRIYVNSQNNISNNAL